MTTTQTPTKARALPWLQYSEDVDRQIAAGLAREQARGPRTVNGTPSYRDAGSNDRYTVGYGGERHYETKPARVVNGASPAQGNLIDKLLVEKEHSYTEAQVTEAKADWRKTRKMIDTLIAATRRPYQAPVQVTTPRPANRLNFDAIPDGNYAIDEGDDLIKFYRVSTNGQWKNVQVRASDALHPIKGRAGIAILHRIVEAGLAESQMLFSTKMDACWMCGRSLTDKESRARGMGPDCASK